MVEVIMYTTKGVKNLGTFLSVESAEAVVKEKLGHDCEKLGDRKWIMYINAKTSSFCELVEKLF